MKQYLFTLTLFSLSATSGLGEEPENILYTRSLTNTNQFVAAGENKSSHRHGRSASRALGNGFHRPNHLGRMKQPPQAEDPRKGIKLFVI